MDFVSLGMFILDDIYYPLPRAPVTDIIGGAGSYAVLGARIMQGSGHGIGWTVHVGSDFPEHVRKEIESWGTECQFIDTPGRLTTRGLNTYRQQERRGKEKCEEAFAEPFVYWRLEHFVNWYFYDTGLIFSSRLATN